MQFFEKFIGNFKTVNTTIKVKGQTHAKFQNEKDVGECEQGNRYTSINTPLLVAT
jgi:hypothetical protein